MKSFAREFLCDELGPGRQLFLGAFGKHPGWDDHIDDIGLETESLVAAKKLLYVDGIGSQIGAWEQLDWTGQIAFNHAFLWRRGSQMLVGRMWASSDGKKRSRYPMIVCAHGISTSLAMMIETVLTALEDLQARVMATRSAHEVREIIGQFRTALREWLATSGGEAPAEEFETEAFLQKGGIEPDDDAFHKTLSRLRRSRFAAGTYKSRGAPSAERLRLLSRSAAAGDCLHFWARILELQLDRSVPLLLAKPAEQYWMDVVAGEPSPADFFCLRASPRVVPLVSDEAEEVPVSFRAEARALIEAAAAGRSLPEQAGGSWVGRLFGR